MNKDDKGRRRRGGYKRDLNKGVHWRPERKAWCARINIALDGKEKNIFLGHYDTQEDALAARAEAVKRLLAQGPEAFRK